MSGNRGLSQNLHREHIRMKLLAVLILASGLLAACDWFDRDIKWKQEVRLQDGRTIIVDRISKVTGKRFPEGGNYDTHQELALTHPDTGERIDWSPPKGSGPLMVDVDGAKVYFVVRAISVGDYNNLGCPNPPFIVYRYADKQWASISIVELPLRFEKPNLQVRSAEDLKAVADRIVTYDEFQAYLHDIRLRQESRVISREKINPIAQGCRQGVLMNQGRHSEIDTRR